LAFPVQVRTKELHLELAQLEKSKKAKSTTTSSPGKSKGDPSARKQQKALIEKRLKRLIYRCDLYCKRRQMLHKMGLL